MGLAVVAAALVAPVPAGPAPAVAAETPTVPMCSGRKDPSLVLTAHANGRPNGVPKFVLNVSTDPAGIPTGSLVFGRGPGHLVVTEFCRVWQHTPGTESNCETEYPEGATTAHAVGTTWLNGVPVVVRADVRETAEGRYFRLRYRQLGEHDEAMTAKEEGGDECEGGWTRYPSEEGWALLDQFRLRVTR
jgi:hypothetical protein